MRIKRADPTTDKAWWSGPWNSDLTISVGYANKGLDDPHVHLRTTEVYLVACGTSEIRVEQESVCLRAGDMIVIEPDEAHTFTSSSPEYFHFVVHVPRLPSEEARADRSSVRRSRLGL